MERSAQSPAVPGQARDDEVRFRLTIRTTLVICPTPSRDAGSGTGSLAATPRAGACQGDHISGCGELPNVRQGMGATRPADASHRRARNSQACRARQTTSAGRPVRVFPSPAQARIRQRGLSCACLKDPPPWGEGGRRRSRWWRGVPLRSNADTPPSFATRMPPPPMGEDLLVPPRHGEELERPVQLPTCLSQLDRSTMP